MPGEIPGNPIANALLQAQQNQTVVRIGVNGEHLEGKVVEMEYGAITLQPWRSPIEARALTEFAAVASGGHRAPMWPFSRWVKEPEPTVFEPIAFSTTPSIVRVDDITYVKELN